MKRSLSVATLVVVLGIGPLLAQRQVCRACGGAGSKTIDRRMFEPCKRCGGKGTIKTGKITVPCSGCGGAGGKNRTIKSQETCRACGGKGYR